MSDMITWAEKEVELAIAREKEASAQSEDALLHDWDYGVACYESALKAYKSLMEDGHSGMSISITKQILNYLIEGKPLTPIEDTPDIWEALDWGCDGSAKKYRCKRMSGLFKDVYSDGTVNYSDVNRVVCSNINNPSVAYTSGLVRKIMDEMFPISFPYVGATMHVMCEDFLTDPKNGDFDTVGIIYISNPDGTHRRIDRYFKEGERDWIEIDKLEYLDRKYAAQELMGENSNGM